MASKVAEAIKREKERRELLDRLDNLEIKIDRLIEAIEGADESAPPRQTRKTKREAQTQ